MHTSLKPTYDKLQADLQNLYNELKGHPDVVLNKKLSSERWSVLQIMHHLILAEQLSINYVNKKMSFQPDYKKAGMMTGFRHLGLKLYLGNPFKFKAPDIVGDDKLPEKSTFWETVKKWNATREELNTLLENFPPELLNKEVYKHTVGGRLTIKQMLQFFDGHFVRHRKQIRKTIKEYHFVV